MTTAVILGFIAIVAIVLLVSWMLVKFLKWAFGSKRRGYRGSSRSGGFWDDIGDLGDFGGGDSD